MFEYDEFVGVHYPVIFEYVILIAHEDANGIDCLGSGVKIAWGNRHFIATAAHCLKRTPRVIRDDKFCLTTENKVLTSPKTRILKSWMHDTLDVGCLEIDEALGAEMTEEQLHCNPVVDGFFHIIGIQTCRNEVNERLKDNRGKERVRHHRS